MTELAPMYTFEAPPADIVFGDYVSVWRSRRAPSSPAVARNIDWSLNHHLLPEFGADKIVEIPRRRVALWHQRCGAVLAKSTASQLLGRLRVIISDALLDLEEVVGIRPNPCDLPARLRCRPEPILDRYERIFSVEECRQLTTDRKIPPDRRLLYALLWMTGLRIGAIGGLRWGDIQANEPLDAFVVQRHLVDGVIVEGTKTVNMKRVPIHPWLASCIAYWRKTYSHYTGQEITPDAAVIPRRMIAGPRKGIVVPREGTHLYNDLKVDLRALGLPTNRSPHDFRASFCTHAEEAGCNASVMEKISHPNAKDVVGGYKRHGWSRMCEEILKIPT